MKDERAEVKKEGGREEERGEQRENRCLWGKTVSNQNPNSSEHEEISIHPLSDPSFLGALSQKHSWQDRRLQASTHQMHSSNTSGGKSSLSLWFMVFLFFIYSFFLR